MTEWWETAYKGGGPARPKGFPRPLYPPDAQGYQPSDDGPDVVAYKRTISRLGRWPWQTFDDSYSNNFAHGTSGNVPETGVAGFQRQMKIKPTGYIGQATYDNMRYALIPEELPHGGEQGMDATAVNLINQAYDMFRVPLRPQQTPPLRRIAMPSPNYSSRGGADVRLIVLHTAEGARTIEELGNFFANPSSQVSSHTGIDDKDGVIGEYVQRPNKAWTAAGANPVAVQVELCAFARWTAIEWNNHPNMLENCARWIAEEAKRFNIPIQQLSASQAQGSSRGVCQHADLGAWGGGHWDCGSGFPMDRVVRRARELNV
jgi:hypothetical protein